jgi:hypothetical protein
MLHERSTFGKADDGARQNDGRMVNRNSTDDERSKEKGWSDDAHHSILPSSYLPLALQSAFLRMNAGTSRSSERV